MAENFHEAPRRTEEKRQSETDSKELAERRRHEIRLAKIPLYTALITALLGLIGTIFTAVWKAGTAGEKVNSSTGASTSPINNVIVGIRTFIKLGSPSVPLTAVLPQGPSETLVSNKPPTLIHEGGYIAPSSTSADPGTDADILKRCSGAEPLRFARVFISSNGSGYRVAIKLSNPSATDTVSILDEYAHRGITLSSNRATGVSATALQEELSSLTRGDASEDDKKKAFGMGLQVGPGESTTVTADFGDRNATAVQGNVNTRLFYVIQNGNDERTVANRSLTCDALPIYAVSKL